MFHRTLRGFAATVALVLAAGLFQAVSSPAQAADNPPTPGAFRGYAFDQCEAPNQHAMNRWMLTSRFLGAGIYISGASRGCQRQANLDKTWVAKQLRKGWKLFPIHFGAQASCHPAFPRYGNDPTINPSPGRGKFYPQASRQGVNNANQAVNAARDLGIPPQSTLFLDVEAFNIGNTHCRESVLRFVSSYTKRLHQLGYLSGFYSSAASGIKAVYNRRAHNPTRHPFHAPDQLWIARWDGKANTQTSYIGNDFWKPYPYSRLKQYQGGHRETHGGVTINIDTNWVLLGKKPWGNIGSHCNGTPIAHKRFLELAPGNDHTFFTRALQCLLKERGFYDGRLDGIYDRPVIRAARNWQRSVDMPVSSTFDLAHWTTIQAQGHRPILKFGSAGEDVSRIYRAMNATPGAELKIRPYFTKKLYRAVRAYKRANGLGGNGVVDKRTWNKLQAGG